MQTPPPTSELDALLTQYLVLNPAARAAISHHLDFNFCAADGDLKTGIAAMVCGMLHMHNLHVSTRQRLAIVCQENEILHSRIAELEDLQTCIAKKAKFIHPRK